MTVQPVRIVSDCFGSYEVPADSIMATAPRRKDGWWDRRTIAGKAAVEEFARNQSRRAPQ